MVVMAKIALKPDDTWHSNDMLGLSLDAVLPQALLQSTPSSRLDAL